MSKPKLALIPSGYKSGKVYSILPNDATGDFDFDRASEGTRVRKDGLIEEVTNDVPRLDWYNSNCPSLLLEPQRTNLFQRSEEFDNSYWTKARASVTADKIIAPNGGLTAEQFFDSTDNNSHLVYRSISVTNGVEYSFSCFMKKGTLTKGFLAFNSASAQTVVFDLENGTVESQGGDIDSSSIDSYGNDWYRCSFTHTTTSTTFLYRVGTYDGGITYTGTGTDYIYIWGAQLEQGDYPTSYIKTAGSTVTRLKDECINGGDSDLFDITEGTFFVDVTPYKSDSSFTAISLNDDSANNRVEMFFYGGTNQVRFVLAGGGSGLSLDNYETITYNTRNKMAVTFNGSTAKVYLNGSLEHTDTSVDAMVGLDRLEFTLFNGTLNFEGKVHDTRVYDRVLTEAEAIELTTL